MNVLLWNRRGTLTIHRGAVNRPRKRPEQMCSVISRSHAEYSTCSGSRTTLPCGQATFVIFTRALYPSSAFRLFPPRALVHNEFSPTLTICIVGTFAATEGYAGDEGVERQQGLEGGAHGAGERVGSVEVVLLRFSVSES